MPTKKWFVVTDDGEMGPLGPGGLRKLVRRREVFPGTMVRREDHEFAIRADQLRGLFDADRRSGDGEMTTVRSHDLPQVHGPFTSLVGLGWAVVAAMGLWVLVGALGAFTALSQRATAQEIAAGGDRPLSDAWASFLGLGGVLVAVLFLATGVLFVYWLWLARLNVPHLIQARIRYAPTWAISGWFVPVLNFARPYQVLDEVDRLSAEAKADGDAAVRSERRLLTPWWIATLVLVACAIVYALMPATTAEEVASVALVHLAVSLALVVAAGFAAVVVLRVSREQELAHAEHPEPVRLHHELGKKRQDAAQA